MPPVEAEGEYNDRRNSHCCMFGLSVGSSAQHWLNNRLRTKLDLGSCITSAGGTLSPIARNTVDWVVYDW